MGYLGDPNAGGFLTDPSVVDQPKRGQLSTEMRTQDLVNDTGLTREELKGLTDSNAIAFSHITQQELAPFNSVDILSTLIDAGATLEELEDAATKKDKVDRAMAKVEEFTSVDLALAKDPRVGGLLFQIEHRRGDVQRKLFDMAEQFEDGATGSVLEFIDQIGYETFVGMRDVVEALSGEGTEISALSDEWLLALRTYSDEEFDAFVAERMDDLTSSPLSGSEASWRVVKELQALDAAGAVLWDEEMGVLSGVMSAIDIATLGASGATAGWRIGRSVLGRLRGSAGTLAATEAAKGTSVVIRGGLDGEIIDAPLALEDFTRGYKPRESRIKGDVIDAEFIDDMAPAAVSTKVSHTSVPPISSGAVGQAFNANKFIEAFLSFQAQKGFGTSSSIALAKEWAEREATRLASASGTSMIDYNIVEEGIKNAKVTFKFGKQDGKPFKTFEAAVKHSEDLPAARIIDTRTGKVATEATKSDQYAVQVELNAPLRGGVKATDISKVTLRTAIGRIFGRSDYGSSSFMANLADAADFGSLGLLNTFKPTIRAAYKALRKDAEAVNTILTTLRDTPTGGQPRQWLSSGEFYSSYKALIGKEPTKELIHAYQEMVELSDFSWWVMANDRLKSLANQEALLVRIGSEEKFAYRKPEVLVASLKADRRKQVWVWDAQASRRVSIYKVDDSKVILPLQNKLKDGSEYVINFSNVSRRPLLDDAFPYNAGGPRSNPDISWFIGSEDGGWATLIGARSERDANIAVSQFNAIAREARLIFGSEEASLSALTKTERAHLDSLVKANNAWNPDIEDFEDFMKFSKLRGVSAVDPVMRRGRGEKISSFTQSPDAFYLNMDLDTYVTYHRHDQALIEFGGAKASNPDPILAIHTQFNRMVRRGAETQYRMNHPTAWVKAVERAMKRRDISEVKMLHPATDEMKVRSMEIVGDSEVARKLKQEQAVITRRLDMLEGSQSHGLFYSIGSNVSKATQRATEIAHNIDPTLGDVARWVKGKTDNTSNILLSFGFFQRMASFDQVLLQGSHAMAITHVSPRNGFKAIQLASVIRQAARDADPTLWKAVYQRLQVTTGLPAAELDDLMKHVFFSGRGYMKGAIAEDPSAGLSYTVLGKTKDVLSAPYYAGENFAATVSRITAYLDTRTKFPTVSVKSDSFWNLVQARDRDLSFSLNKAQRSMVQTDPTLRVVTQWTSYPMRTIETLFFNSNLTKVERGRLAAWTTMYWGLAGLGLYNVARPLLPDSMPEWLVETVLYGADAAIDGLLGVKIGDRIATNPGQLFDRVKGTIQNPLYEIPAFKLVGDTTASALQGLTNVFSGRWGLLGHDAMTLARAWKVVDSAALAFTMATEDIRRSKGGQIIGKDFTPMQEVLQAIGLKPSEATEMFHASEFLFNQRERQKKAIEQATPVFIRALEAIGEGNNAKGLQLIKDADSIVESYHLSDVYLGEARDTIFERAGFDRINWMVLELIKAGYEDYALQLREQMK